MSARKTEQEIAVRHPRETSELFGHREAEAALLNAYRSGKIPHAWLIGGPAGHRQGDAGLSHGAVRARQRQSAGAAGRARRNAGRRSQRSRSAADHGRGAWRPAGARARPQRPRRAAHRHHGRRDPGDDFVLRLDGGGGWLARLYRRYGRRTQSERRQRAAENPRRTATALAVSAGQPFAGAGAADDPVPLPQIAVAAACDIRCDPRRGAGDRQGRQRSGARRSRRGLRGQRVARADAARRRCAETAAAHRGAAGDVAKVSIRASCMRWATRSAPATAWRWRPSSTVSTAGSAKSCAPATPTPICRALHGWRRYGKRSSAPRATPNRTIWNENRWFSRFSECSRKRRGNTA